jgi:hypothetical protein
MIPVQIQAVPIRLRAAPILLQASLTLQRTRCRPEWMIIQVGRVLCRVDPIQYRNQQSVIRMFALFPSMIPVRIPEDLIQSQEAQILPNNVQ